MKFVHYASFAVLGILFCTSGFAAERKGFQAVGLSKWSSASASNCAAAVIASGIGEFEFAFMPFFNAENPFNNVGTMLTIPNVSKVETIFLSWRDEPELNISWSNTLNVLRSRAQEVNTHISAVRNSVTKIIVIPMLEDNWTEPMWLETVSVIAGQIDNGADIYFRRSEMVGTDLPPSSITTKLKSGLTYNFTSTRLEAHRLYHNGDAQVMSNDGGFVYQDAHLLGKYESNASAPGTNGHRTLATWAADAGTTTKVSILWRPCYNLWTRTLSGPVGNQLITYQKPSTPLNNRSDSDSAPAFDSFEKEVLKTFLQ